MPYPLQTPLMAAIAQKDEPLALEIIKTADPEMLEQRDLKTHFPLYVAASYDLRKVVLALIIRKVNLDMRTEIGTTALLGAAQEGNGFIVTQLLRAGANPRIPNNAGKTPYDVAVSQYKFEVAKIFQTEKANLPYDPQFFTVFDIPFVACDATITPDELNLCFKESTLLYNEHRGFSAYALQQWMQNIETPDKEINQRARVMLYAYWQHLWRASHFVIQPESDKSLLTFRYLNLLHPLGEMFREILNAYTRYPEMPSASHEILIEMLSDCREQSKRVLAVFEKKKQNSLSLVLFNAEIQNILRDIIVNTHLYTSRSYLALGKMDESLSEVSRFFISLEQHEEILVKIYKNDIHFIKAIANGLLSAINLQFLDPDKAESYNQTAIELSKKSSIPLGDSIRNGINIAEFYENRKEWGRAFRVAQQMQVYFNESEPKVLKLTKSSVYRMEFFSTEKKLKTLKELKKRCQAQYCERLMLIVDLNDKETEWRLDSESHEFYILLPNNVRSLSMNRSIMSELNKNNIRRDVDRLRFNPCMFSEQDALTLLNMGVNDLICRPVVKDVEPSTVVDELCDRLSSFFMCDDSQQLTLTQLRKNKRNNAKARRSQVVMDDPPEVIEDVVDNDIPSLAKSDFGFSIPKGASSLTWVKSSREYFPPYRIFFVTKGDDAELSMFKDAASKLKDEYDIPYMHSIAAKGVGESGVKLFHQGNTPMIKLKLLSRENHGLRAIGSLIQQVRDSEGVRKLYIVDTVLPHKKVDKNFR